MQAARLFLKICAGFHVKWLKLGGLGVRKWEIVRNLNSTQHVGKRENKSTEKALTSGQSEKIKARF